MPARAVTLMFFHQASQRLGHDSACVCLQTHPHTRAFYRRTRRNEFHNLHSFVFRAHPSAVPSLPAPPPFLAHAPQPGALPDGIVT